MRKRDESIETVAGDDFSLVFVPNIFYGNGPRLSTCGRVSMNVWKETGKIRLHLFGRGKSRSQALTKKA